MPNKERIRQWLDALRSGNYKQGKGALQRNGEFCCLGVACEVAIKNELGIKVSHDADGFVQYGTEYNHLPPVVGEWFGFERGDMFNPRLGDGIGSDAIRANDELKLSFEEIADALEKRYLTNGE